MYSIAYTIQCKMSQVNTVHSVVYSVYGQYCVQCVQSVLCTVCTVCVHSLEDESADSHSRCIAQHRTVVPQRLLSVGGQLHKETGAGAGKGRGGRER